MMNGLCGEWVTTLRSVAPDDIKKTKGLRWEYQVTAANAGERVQFRFAVDIHWPGMAEFERYANSL